jgi:hypothetical protein
VELLGIAAGGILQAPTAFIEERILWPRDVILRESLPIAIALRQTIFERDQFAENATFYPE